VPVFERISAIHDCVPSCEKILDLGGGDGIYAPFLSDKARMVVCLDLDVERLRRAKKVCKFVVRGDAARLPFPDKAFDAVWASELIEHLPSLFVFNEIERVADQVIATMPNLLGPILLVDFSHMLHLRYAMPMFSRFLEQRKWKYGVEGLGLCLPFPVPLSMKKAFLNLSRHRPWLAFTILIRGKFNMKDVRSYRGS